MFYVTQCNGNCATCQVKRTAQVVQLPIENQPSVVEEEPVVEPVMARASFDVEPEEELEETMALSVVPFTEVGIVDSPVVENYTVKKTRKGLVGKLIGG